MYCDIVHKLTYEKKKPNLLDPNSKLVCSCWEASPMNSQCNLTRLSADRGFSSTKKGVRKHKMNFKL